MRSCDSTIAGVGESEIALAPGESAFDYWNAIEETKDYRDAVEDVSAAARTLLAATESLGVDLSVVGYSFGAATGMLFACRESRVRRMVAVAPPLGKVSFEFLSDCRKPSLHVVGKKDFLYSDERMAVFRRSVGPAAEVVVLDEADHFFRGEENSVARRIEEYRAWHTQLYRIERKSSMGLEKKPEILAPAGTLDAVRKVIDAGADAVYVGGKGLNMRQHRTSYNLTEAEIGEAIDLVHREGKRLYFTLNSLVLDSQIPQLREILAMLGRLGPDAIIVQDLAVASLAREICVHVPLHASTMMNVHSVETALALEDDGLRRGSFPRATSRCTRSAASAKRSGLEMECFVHGDMCISQSSQCYLSAILFGESANCGRCMKQLPVAVETGSSAQGNGGARSILRRATSWPARTCACCRTFRRWCRTASPP